MFFNQKFWIFLDLGIICLESLEYIYIQLYSIYIYYIHITIKHLLH